MARKFYEIRESVYSGDFKHMAYLSSLSKARDYLRANMGGKISVSRITKNFSHSYTYYNSIKEIPSSSLKESHALISENPRKVFQIVFCEFEE